MCVHVCVCVCVFSLKEISEVPLYCISYIKPHRTVFPRSHTLNVIGLLEVVL